MFERFTDEARRVVVLAQEEARTLDHDEIGTEHLLLGLVHEDDAEVCKVLGEFGVDIHAMRHAVLAVVGRGTEPSPSHLPFTRPAKKALELSLRESLQLGHREIRPTHILLGLLRTGDGVAATVLTRQGLSLDDVRQMATRAPGDERARPERRRGIRRLFRSDDDDEEPTSATPLLLERFDDQAWEALTYARASARRRATGRVDTQDLLIGVASVPGPAASALEAIGADAQAVVAVDLDTGASGDGGDTALGLTGSARHVLRWAAEDAQRRGQPAAGTAHILLALLVNADDHMQQVLDALAIVLSDLHAEVARRMA
ncbi:MAG TPA: Clp protease N-terminal domain-containing protein [Euzebyales bacterium]